MSPRDTGAIQRVLFIAAKVHIYAVPPLSSNKGYAASQWTQNEPIFTARLRITETALHNQPTPAIAPATSNTSRAATAANPTQAKPTPSPSQPASTSTQRQDALAVSIVLEDPSSGELFAEAPYTHHTAVSPCTDSSRFFAVRVVGDGGRKATLGVGFEDRSEAFDFGIALEEARKVLGIAVAGGGAGSGGERGSAAAGKTEAAEQKRDLSLKEGEMIRVNIGRRGKAAGGGVDRPEEASKSGGLDGGFAGQVAGGPLLPPPPSAADVKRHMSQDVENEMASSSSSAPTAENLGFDDGEFGEFQ